MICWFDSARNAYRTIPRLGKHKYCNLPLELYCIRCSGLEIPVLLGAYNSIYDTVFLSDVP